MPPQQAYGLLDFVDDANDFSPHGYFLLSLDWKTGWT
jgi:hypothetical protein